MRALDFNQPLYFLHVVGFSDNTAYIHWDPPAGKFYAVSVSGLVTELATHTAMMLTTLTSDGKYLASTAPPHGVAA